MSSSGGAVAMDADAPWSSDVSTFVSPDRHVPDAARVEARTRLAALLGSGRLTFLALLRGMEACLVTTDDAVRARGVLLLAELVARPARSSSPPPALPASAAPLLAQFFVSKLEDFAAIRAALAGCAALLTADAVDDRGVRAPAVDRAGAVEMADRFFDAVHVPSLVQADRAKAYELLAALVSRADDQDRDENAPSGARGPPLGSAPPAEQLELIVAACDGEKDPRNVLLVCELWALLPRAFCGAAASDGSDGSGSAPSAAAAPPSPAHAAAFASAAEELYDVVAAYFPVSFRPPANDRVLVTHEQLAATLRSAMCASPSYAPWAVPHVLESLDETKPPKTLDDALATVCACGASFGREAMRPHLRAVWGALRIVLLRPPAGPELTAEGAARWATRCFAAEWSRSDVNDDVDATAAATASLSLVSLALEDACLSDAASALSGAAAGGGAAASGAGGCCGGRAHEGGASGGEGGGEGGGCCGGGGGGEGLGSAAAEAPVSPKTPVSSRETTRRGHALVAGAGRVLGAVAAASPAAARASIARGLAPLLDAAGVGPSGELDAVAPGVAPLALVLAMPAVCGALDGASVRSRGDVNDAPKESSPSSSSSSSSSSVLGATGRRLAGLFAAAARRGVAGAGALRGDPSDDEKEAAADEIPSSIAEEDGVTLGVAGLKALLAFPAGEFLRGEDEEGGDSTVDVAVGALTDAAVDVEAEEAADDSDASADAQAVFAARAAARITSRRRAAEALARAAAMPAAHPAAVSVARRATPALVSAFDAGRRRGASDSAARRRGVAALDAAAAAANAAPSCRAAAVPALCAAAAATLAGKGGDEGGVGDEATWSALADALAGAEASEGSEAAASSSASEGSFEGSFGEWSPAPKAIPRAGMLAASVSPAESAESAAARSLAGAALDGFGVRAADSRAARVARSAVAACDETTRLELATRAVATLARGDAANAEAFHAAAAVATGACERTLLAAFETLDGGGGGLDVFATLAGMATRDGDEARAAAAADALATALNKIGDKIIAVGGAAERGGDASAALERAFAGGLCTRASLRHAAGAGAAAKALRALFARGDAAADALAARLREALGADAADGDANDAGSVSSDSPDEATKTRVTNSVSSGAARAFGLAMAPGGGGLGVARAARARVKPLATQRFFARTLPALLAPLGSSSSASAPLLGRANRAAYLRAFLHLARHAPRAALVQTVATTLPILAEAIESAAGFDRRGDEGETGVFFATGAKKPTGESAADPDALASGLALASAFLSDDRAREALAAHAERHAGALVSALCRVSVSVSRDGGLAMAAREDALDALAAAAERGSLPFAAVYPRRREATEAATRALDDPKRRVRRMAARCKEAWRELGEAQ